MFRVHAMVTRWPFKIVFFWVIKPSSNPVDVICFNKFFENSVRLSLVYIYLQDVFLVQFCC